MVLVEGRVEAVAAVAFPVVEMVLLVDLPDTDWPVVLGIAGVFRRTAGLESGMRAAYLLADDGPTNGRP